MSGKHGGAQKLLQDKLGQDIIYVQCFNHQLHLVVIHATEVAMEDFFNVCNKKFTIAIYYKGGKLKCLLDQ